MKSAKKIFWGIVLVLAAVFLLVSQMGLIPELHIGFWTIVWTLCAGYLLVRGIVKFQFSGIFFGLAFLGIIYDEMLGITAITPWPILGAALLLSIGCHMLFPKRKHEKIVQMTFTDGDGVEHNIREKGGMEEQECHQGADGEYLEFTQVFKSATKYVQSSNLKSIEIECVFSNMELYLNNALLADGVAMMDVETVFGNTTIYVPADWIVEERTENVFGSVTYKGTSHADGRNRLILNGEVVFGNIKVVYI